MAMTTANKIALITGATRGIGAATAVALAKRGIASVLAVRDPQSAEPVATAVRALSVSCRIERCDVADQLAVQSVVQRIQQDFNRLDIVINNAGRIDPIGHLADTDPAQWAATVSVNLVGAYNVIFAALPVMLARSEGAIVNLSSGAAHTPREGWSAYCSSKAALAMLTRCVAHEYADRGISAFGLQPGLVATDMQRKIRQSGMNEISRIPEANLAPPERSAEVIAWLADQRPKALAGRDLTLDEALSALNGNAQNA